MTMAAWSAVKVAFALGLGLNIAGFLGWLERKQSAVIQDRLGANRASIFGFRLLGLFHPLADALKMLSKEDFIPKHVNRPFYAAAPAVTLGFALLGLAALPYGGDVTLWGHRVSLQPIESPFGLALVLAALSMGVHGIVMAGYASASNYALLGGLRGAAQMLAYEVCLAASLAGPLFLYGTLDLQEAVRRQGHWIAGFLPAWGIFLQPFAFILFLTAGTALTKRAPFDLPEGEAEIIGYHVEYSGMKFGMFLMTDFIESIMVAGLVTTLFLGGWQIPGLALDGLSGAILMVASFTAKTLLVLGFMMQIRWTLPRLRFDQLLDLGWKNVLPLSLANIILTSWGVYLWR